MSTATSTAPTSPPIPVPPVKLLAFLAEHEPTPDALHEHFGLDDAAIDDLFHHADLAGALRRRTKLQSLGLQAKGLRRAATAFTTLDELTHCEKPEVARRASVALLHLAACPPMNPPPPPPAPCT